MSDDIGRLTRLLPLACLAAAICLFASELMTTFAFTPPGGEVLQVQGGADRHGNALMVIAVFAIGALAVAVFAASKPAALAVAIAGVIALLVFLLVDLPQGGFFLEMAGALALAVTGVALATLTPEQLAALRPRRAADRGRRDQPATAYGSGATAAHDAKEQPDQQHRLTPRRPRARQRG